MTEIEFKNIIEKENPEITYESGFMPELDLMENNIIIKCKEMNHIYTSNLDINLKVKKCKSCVGNALVRFQQKGKENYLKDMTKNEPEYEWQEEYKRDNKKKHLILHKTCGNIYLVRPNDFQQGYRCPECSRNESRLAKEFTKFLTEGKVLFEKEKDISKPTAIGGHYKIDFVLNNLSIEIDGEQHFRTSSKWSANGRIRLRDNEKNSFFIINKKTLIRIPYHSYKEVKKRLKLLKTVVAAQNNNEELIKIAKENNLYLILNGIEYTNNYYKLNDLIYENKDTKS